MPFDPNDYPLGKEYQARMMKQAHQDHLAEETRTNSTRRTVIGKKRVTFAVVVIVVTSILLASLPQALLAKQPVNARTVSSCSQTVVASTLAPEWVAVRQQYERSYQPVTIQNPQTAIARVAALPALAPEWVAVRQQYEPGYKPVETGCVRASCSSLAPEWVAVRQQYERSYVPPCQN
jgi:hypothetical protein